MGLKELCTLDEGSYGFTSVTEEGNFLESSSRRSILIGEGPGELCSRGRGLWNWDPNWRRRTVQSGSRGVEVFDPAWGRGIVQSRSRVVEVFDFVWGICRDGAILLVKGANRILEKTESKWVNPPKIIVFFWLHPSPFRSEIGDTLSFFGSLFKIPGRKVFTIPPPPPGKNKMHWQRELWLEIDRTSNPLCLHCFPLHNYCKEKYTNIFLKKSWKKKTAFKKKQRFSISTLKN